jgi:hypothetical protein
MNPNAPEQPNNPTLAAVDVLRQALGQATWNCGIRFALQVSAAFEEVSSFVKASEEAKQKAAPPSDVRMP